MERMNLYVEDTKEEEWGESVSKSFSPEEAKEEISELERNQEEVPPSWRLPTIEELSRKIAQIQEDIIIRIKAGEKIDPEAEIDGFNPTKAYWATTADGSLIMNFPKDLSGWDKSKRAEGYDFEIAQGKAYIKLVH